MEETVSARAGSANRAKFIVGGLLIVAAIVYLIVTSTRASAQYFMTVDELVAKEAVAADQDVRVSGAVIGDSITYDPETRTSWSAARESC